MFLSCGRTHGSAPTVLIIPYYLLLFNIINYYFLYIAVNVVPSFSLL